MRDKESHVVDTEVLQAGGHCGYLFVFNGYHLQPLTCSLNAYCSYYGNCGSYQCKWESADVHES